MNLKRRLLVLCLTALVSLWAAHSARAHFIFIVPSGDGVAKVVLSETLVADPAIDAGTFAGAKLFYRDVLGNQKPLTLAKGEHEYTLKYPGNGARVLYGTAELGVQQHGKGKPYLLFYCPKTIVGEAFDDKATLGNAAPVEIVPMGKAGEVRFQVLIDNKPAGGAEVTVIPPDGKAAKVVADARGVTESFKEIGRYGVWAKKVQTISGEASGKRYEEIRHYATLVIDLPASSALGPAAVGPNRCGPMPEAASSFGAVACDGWLYVYGGHIALTHNYSTEAVSGRFHRLNLANPKSWEELPGGPRIQGMNLAAYDGKIYRVGGMEPRNAPGEKADNYSLRDCARFDLQTRRWDQMPPMPEGRSSHDIAVVDGQLMVIGGWCMKGKEGNTWPSSALVMDLKAPNPQWKFISQPFARRALIVAVLEGKLYVMGGFDSESDPSRQVEVYDPKANSWSAGPELPGKDINGFAPAACALGGRLYVSVADGTMYRLSLDRTSWEKVATTTPRIVHRLAPFGHEVLVIGGASKGNNLDLIESVDMTTASRIP